MRRSSRAIGWCELHGKLLYDTRKKARIVARSHREDHKSVYRCNEQTSMFHVGAVPDEVISGRLTREEYFRNAL